MKTLNTLIIFLALLTHSSLFCVKLSTGYRLIKLAKRLDPHEVPKMITCYLQNPKNVPTALKLLERAIRCGDTFAAAVLLSSHDPRLAKALKKDTVLTPTTLSHFCVMADEPGILACLLKAGAPPKDADGKPSLFDAVFCIRSECVATLLKDGNANPNARAIAHEPGAISGTPLHWNARNLAPEYGDLENLQELLNRKLQIAKDLIDHGADPLRKDSDGKTVFQVLDDQPNQEIAGKLKEFLLTYNPKQKII